MQIFKSNLFVISVLILFCINNLQAQDKQTNIDSVGNHVFDVYFINGYALGYNVLSNPNSELRVILDISTSYSNMDEEIENSHFGGGILNSYYRSQVRDYTDHRIYLSAQYLITLYKTNLGKAYFGFGPFFGYGWNKMAEENTQAEGSGENSESRNSISMGITTLIGIRSTLTNSLSIYAEAQLSGGKSYYTTNYTGTGKL